MSELGIGNMRDHAFSSTSYHHQMRTIFLRDGSLITHHFDISGQ